MSNNINQENKKRTFNGNKKFTKKPRVNPNELKASLSINKTINEDMYNEILDVLSNTRFDKISIPVGILKSFIDPNVDADDSRIVTIGYIRNYNAETKEFKLIIFNAFLDQIKNLAGDFSVDALFTETRDNTLGTITKFTIYPTKDVAAEDVETTEDSTAIEA